MTNDQRLAKQGNRGLPFPYRDDELIYWVLRMRKLRLDLSRLELRKWYDGVKNANR